MIRSENTSFYKKLQKDLLTALAVCLIIGSLSGQSNKHLVKQRKSFFALNADSMQGCINCLIMNGKMELSKNNKAAAIKIYCLDSLYYTLQSSNSTGHFTFYLPINHQYKVVLSKPGYYDKFFTVNTQFSKKRMTVKYEIEFSTDMFKTMEDMNVDVLKQPIVEIEYDKFRDLFVFDPQYTQSIYDDMDKLYTNYKIQQKMEAEDLKASAISGNNN